MLLRRTATVLAGFAALLFLIISASTLHAQTGTTDTGSGLQISPTRTEISGATGEQKTFSVSLRNITKGELSAKAILNDFESDNITGNPKIIIDNTQHTPYSLSNMLKGLQDVDLKAGETKVLKFTLDIPGNASPGAYFGAIRYEVIPKTAKEGERQVALNASVAHLVFLEIPGEVNEKIQIESLNLQNDDKSRSFFFHAPNKAAVSIKNLGNGFSRPFGKVTVSYFSHEVDSYDLNNTDPRGIVLPNSNRKFVNDVHNIKKPGKYSAVAAVAYGNGGEVITYKSTFWYVPLWCLIVLLVLLAAIGGGAYYIYRKRYGKTASKPARPAPRTKK